MARRRTLDGELDMGRREPGGGALGMGLGLGEGFGAGESQAPAPAMMPEGVTKDGQEGSNTERPRDVFPGSAPRSPFAPTPPPAAGMGEPGGVDLSLLPQGVEAQAAQAPQLPQSMEAAPQSTAMAPLAPTPVSSQGLPPASPGAVAPSTPARQPFASPSAIFSAQGPRSIGGRGTGLTGGGLSMPGGPSGASKPTEEMLQLLRSLGVS